MNNEKNIAIFGTGSPDGGGSGARELLKHTGVANRVAALVTNYPQGGIAKLGGENPAISLRILESFPKRGKDGTFSPTDQEKIIQLYLNLVEEFGLEYIFLSGWMKQVLGLEANKVINIHPGPLGEYGGEKMYGDNVHAKIWNDYFDGRIVSSAVTMHFVPSGIEDKMDTGPIIVQVPVLLDGCASQEEIKKQVNAMEHKIQWQITQHIINGYITWSGIKNEPVQFQEGLTIQIDETDFPLNGKTVDLTKGLDTYGNAVVKAGDNASGNFKEECDRAIIETSAYKEGLLRQTKTKSWETIIPASEIPTRAKEDIDGVGTKVQIYLEMFESICQSYRDGKITEEVCIEKSIPIWERMVHDLIAMNADDLRDGQMAVSVTNIIDINHLRGKRGKIFSLSMARALGKATREINIGNVAGETAILGDTKSALSYKIVAETLAKILKELPEPTSEQQEYINNAIGNYSISIRGIENHLDLNIGGTVQGLIQEEKLITLEAGHILVALYEVPDENGIIGPRSNGITAIRKHMETLAGSPNWASMSFEDFLQHIGEGQAQKLPEALLEQCQGLTLGQIATGKTTVFNPFVSRDLLSGLGEKPSVRLSSLIHVTGNPGRKIKEGLRGTDDLAIEIDISNAQIPQIIELIQILANVPDNEMMSSCNMGVPYVIACPESEFTTLQKRAGKKGITAEKIGTVLKKDQGTPSARIRGVGIGKSDIIIS